MDERGVPRQAAFDPVRVGRHECAAWAAYYRQEWGTVLRSSVGMVAEGFRMGGTDTLRGAWCVLQANRAWAPVPDNDPDAARRHMQRFYRLVTASGWGHFDPARAAGLEIEWWRLHRERQRSGGAVEPLIDALAALYACVYAVPQDTMHTAARLRAEAMDVSDAWVAAGCGLTDPLLEQERRTLIASYAALRESVERHQTSVSPAGGQQ